MTRVKRHIKFNLSYGELKRCDFQTGTRDKFQYPSPIKLFFISYKISSGANLRVKFLISSFSYEQILKMFSYQCLLCWSRIQCEILAWLFFFSNMTFQLCRWHSLVVVKPSTNNSVQQAYKLLERQQIHGYVEILT